MLHPQPKMDLSYQHFLDDPIANRRMNRDHVLNLRELSSVRAQFCIYATHQEWNDYIGLRTSENNA